MDANKLIADDNQLDPLAIEAVQQRLEVSPLIMGLQQQIPHVCCSCKFEPDDPADGGDSGDDGGGDWAGSGPRA